MERQKVWSHQLELLDITVSGPCFHSAPCFARIHRRTSDLLQELAPSHLQTRGQVAGWGAKKTYHTTCWIGSPCQCYKLGNVQKPWGTQSYSSQKHIQWTDHIQTTIKLQSTQRKFENHTTKPSAPEEKWSSHSTWHVCCRWQLKKFITGSPYKQQISRYHRKKNWVVP